MFRLAVLPRTERSRNFPAVAEMFQQMAGAARAAVLRPRRRHWRSQLLSSLPAVDADAGMLIVQCTPSSSIS